MAKHIYDENGKYKGEILSDEQRRIKIAHASFGWWEKCYICKDKLRGLTSDGAKHAGRDICWECDKKSNEIKDQLIHQAVKNGQNKWYNTSWVWIWLILFSPVGFYGIYKKLRNR